MPSTSSGIRSSIDPDAPAERDTSLSHAQRLAQKYGRTVPQAQEMIDRMTETARADGLDFKFEISRSGNTFDAHRLLHLASQHGKQNELKERFFRGYFTEGEPIGDREALVRMASEVGIDADEARAALASDAHSDEVRDDEREARELGIRGVPFFVFDQRYAVSGAQPADLLAGALDKAYAELKEKPSEADPLAEGAACTPDGCP